MDLNTDRDSSKANAGSPPVEPPGPPVIASPPPLSDRPVVPPGPPSSKPSSLRKLLVVVLSLCLALFVADGVVSLLDDSLILLFGVRVLTGVRAVVFFFAILLAILTYVLMGLTPMIPKRLFLPITLFNPAAALAIIPLLIYFYGYMQQFSWAISVCQAGFGIMVLWWLRQRSGARWPLMPEGLLGTRRFSWLNLSAFVLTNLFLVLPGVLAFLFFCASLAANHFSNGFVALRPGGMLVQARKYVRDDGKTIQLFPMAHVGEGTFYREISSSFGSNSVVLVEGVTDRNNLLTNHISYKRVAKSLGLTEQHEEFKPVGGEWVSADVDVELFTPETIGFLNLVMRMYVKGINAETVLPILQYAPAPGFEKRLFDDLLRKRNKHLLEVLHSRLPESDYIIVPWGAAHMPEIAEEIQKSGFRLQETQDHQVIRFFR